MTAALPPAGFDSDVDARAGIPVRELATETPAPQRNLSAQVIHVELEDGTSFDVQVANKDYIRWDKTPAQLRGVKGSFQEHPFVFASFLAWAAASRTGLTDLTWAQFQDQADVVEQVKQEDVPPTS